LCFISRGWPIQDDLRRRTWAIFPDPPGSYCARYRARDRLHRGCRLLASLHIWPFSGEYLLWAISAALPDPRARRNRRKTFSSVIAARSSLGSGAFMAIGAYSAYKLGTGGSYSALPGLASRFRSRRCPCCYPFCSAGSRRRLPESSSVFPVYGSRASIWRLQRSQHSSSSTGCYLRVPWFTNYAPSGSVNAPGTEFFFGLIVRTPNRALSAVPDLRDRVSRFWRRNLVRGNLGRQWMAIRDMDIAAELIGIRPTLRKAQRLSRSLHLSSAWAGALWAFVYLGSWGAARLLDRPFAAASIHGDHRRVGDRSWVSFVGAAFILISADHAEPDPKPSSVYPLSTETITHLEFIIFGSLICYLLIKEPHGVCPAHIDWQGRSSDFGPFPLLKGWSVRRKPEIATRSGGRWQRSKESPQKNKTW